MSIKRLSKPIKRVAATGEITPVDCMLDGVNTFIERNKRYGDNYRNFGKIMMALFPDGLVIDSPEMWNRMALVVAKVGKLARYCINPKVGHIDSTHDEGVYSFMLEALDREEEAKRSDCAAEEDVK